MELGWRMQGSAQNWLHHELEMRMEMELRLEEERELKGVELEPRPEKVLGVLVLVLSPM